jgi:hypothetical protein
MDVKLNVTGILMTVLCVGCCALVAAYPELNRSRWASLVRSQYRSPADRPAPVMHSRQLLPQRVVVLDLLPYS